MEPSEIKRKLTAILSADAVSYSRMMHENEDRALRTLADHRRTIDHVIATHEGRIVNTAGDSVLAEFPSSVAAVRCAIEIQEALKTRNDALPEEQRMEFRIGVNLGDVVISGTDLLGDGVNVAARLQSIAEPGGICLSSSVYDQISGKIDLGFVDLGEQNLKNITRPIRVYQLAGANKPVRLRDHPPASHRRVLAFVAVAIAITVLAVAWQLNRPAPKPVAPEPVTTIPATVPSAQAEAEKARLEAEKARAQAELDKVRAEGQVARMQAEIELQKARSEAESLRRKAEQGPRPVMVLPAQSIPEVKPPPRHAENPPSPATSTLVPEKKPDPVQAIPEKWTAGFSCEGPRGRQTPGSPDFSVNRVDGEFIVTKGESGKPGYFLLRGKPQGNRLTLRGTVIAQTPQAYGRSFEVVLSGEPSGKSYLLSGSIGRANCMLDLAPQFP